MAEARLAVAFQFAVTDEGVDIQLDKNALRAVLDAAFRSYKRRLARVRALLSRSFYPTTGYTLFAFVAAVVVGCWLRFDPLGARRVYERVGASTPLLNRFDPFVQETVLNIVVAGLGWLLFAFVRRRFLRLLLSYHGWIFERKPSMLTKIWGLLVMILRGPFKPDLYSFQRSLPHLPLPALKDTCRRYLQTVRPLLKDEDYEEMQNLVCSFQNGVGRKLQRYLYLKYLRSSNYVTDWWEQFVYLRSRSSLMINSNYYAVDAMFLHSTELQAPRAGSVINAIMKYKRKLETGRMDPLILRNIVPLCSSQYERTFGTMRIPGIEQDSIRHVDPAESKHVVVFHDGRWYTVPCYFRGRLLEPVELESQIQRILDDADSEEAVKPGELKLPALTTLARNEWGRLYEQHFKTGKNREAMDILEKAAFIVCLDNDEVFHSPNDQSKIDYMARSLLHGSGCNRWFDKSFCLIVYKNGKVGLTCEHSWADALVLSQMFEWVYAEELEAGSTRFNKDGHCVGEIKCGPLKFPERIEWDLKDDLVEEIEKAAADAAETVKGVQLRLMVHNDFGKKAITSRCKVGPDGFIQMALQLAYYRDQGHLCLTYEASMTRLFREGRTETIRPVTMHSTAFVKAMCDSSATKEEKRTLLRAACENHQNVAKKCMIGEGVDRHLFCLFIISKALKVDSPFLQKVLSEPWRLSTSQTPHSQTNRLDEEKLQVSFGGGFGPVADDGYGVSYVIAGKNIIFFHVSSFEKSKQTDAYRFSDRIRACMAEMLALFE